MTKSGRDADTGLAGTVHLWSNADNTRHFLIPEGASLPSGDLLLHTALGRTMNVGADDAVRWEVDRAEGLTWTQENLRGVLGELFTKGRDTGVGPAAAADGGAEGAASATPGLDLLCDLSGHPREELAGDYKAMGRALREHLGSLGRAALDSVSGDPVRMAAARARMADWNETLKSHGVGAADGEESEGPDTPGARDEPDAREARRGAPDEHPEVGTAASKPGADTGIASQLRAMADAMRRRADALAAAREAAVRDASPSPDAGPSNASDTTGNNPTEGDPGRG